MLFTTKNCKFIKPINKLETIKREKFRDRGLNSTENRSDDKNLKYQIPTIASCLLKIRIKLLIKLRDTKMNYVQKRVKNINSFDNFLNSLKLFKY